MLPTNEKEDVTDAEQILSELRKLSEKELAEDEDVSDLEAAIASVEKYIASEKAEDTAADKQVEAEAPKDSGVVDTGVLTGPINDLKSFLVRKSKDNDQM